MKYCFEEKKKMVSVAASVMFVCIAGIIYVVSGRAKSTDRMENVLKSDDKSSNIVLDINESETDDSGQNDNADIDISDENLDRTEISQQEIVVHICGAVKNPGVYTFKKDIRLADVIDEAGGFKDSAAKNYLNLARHVTDGEQIVVYTKKQLKNNQKIEKNMQETDGSERSNNVVNINSATKEELMNIPGIGESKASDIIDYREKNGLFKEKDEIMNIPGIKEGIYNKISDMITI